MHKPDKRPRKAVPRTPGTSPTPRNSGTKQRNGQRNRWQEWSVGRALFYGFHDNLTQNNTVRLKNRNVCGVKRPHFLLKNGPDGDFSTGPDAWIQGDDTGFFNLFTNRAWAAREREIV